MINSAKLEISLLFFIYFISNIFLLLNFNAIYWDDWAWFYQEDISFVLQAFDQLKVGYKGEFFLFLMNLDFYGAYPFRIFVFIAIFISGLCVYYILSKIEHFDRHSRFFIVLFFLLAPLFTSKMLASISIFYLPVMFFFIGFAIMVKYVNEGNIFNRILALILFTLSFSTNSVLVFYFIIFIFLYYFHFNSFNGILEFIKNMLLISKKYIDFLLIPFLYYIYKSIYMVPWGLYEGYNGISLLKMLNPIKYFESIGRNFFDPIFSSLQETSSIIVFLIFFIYIIDIFKKNKHLNMIEDEKNKKLLLFVIGFIMFIFATMPYIAVDKMPKMGFSDSRFQILLPLGFSILLYYSVLLIFKNNFRKYMLLVLIFSFIIFNIKDQFAWNIDWQYQQSIKQNIEDSEIIKNNSTFLVINQLNDKFYNSRKPPFYEFSGISKQALGTDDKLFVYKSEDVEEYKKIVQYKHYNISNWIESNLVKIYFINTNIQSSNSKILKTILKLKYLEIFDKESYKIEVKKLVEIK